MTDLKSVKVVYSGQVHGVGFRYMAKQVAAVTGVRGYVKNEHNGTVLVICEGREEQVYDFLSRLDAEMAPFIRDVKIEDLIPTGTHTSFIVKF